MFNIMDYSENDNFQKSIYKKYKKYEIKKDASFREICFPSKFTYQLPQLFVSEFINPNTQYKGILLYHKIGAGKTCAAVCIGEQWKHKKKIMFVCPASLIGNIYKELRSDCANNEYITVDESSLLSKMELGSKEYNEMILKINKNILLLLTVLMQIN